MLDVFGRKVPAAGLNKSKKSDKPSDLKHDQKCTDFLSVSDDCVDIGSVLVAVI